MKRNILWGGARLPFSTYQSRRVWMGGQRAKKMVGGTLEVAEFDATIKSAENISIKGTGSEEPAVR